MFLRRPPRTSKALIITSGKPYAMKLNVPVPHDSALACVPNEVQACTQMSRKAIVA